MIIVALDTATSAVTSGVVELRDGAERSGARPVELAATYTIDPRAHAELLAPQLLGCLRAAGLTAADVDAVVVGRGPGPFTGLRVGMATAAAYADALGVPCHPVDTLDAIALSARWRLAGAAAGGDATSGGAGVSGGGAGSDGDTVSCGGAGSPSDVARPLLVCTDARRREAYFSRYDAAGARTEGPAVRAARDIAPSAASGGAEIALGDPVRLAELPAGFEIREDLPTFPAVAALVACAAPALRAGSVPAPLEPLYLRRPDAVPPAPRPVSPALVGRDVAETDETDETARDA